MKLELGDIKMDSRTGISFGNQPEAERPASAQPVPETMGPQTSPAAKASLLERLPDWSRLGYLMAAAVALGLALGLGAVSASLIETLPVWRFVPLVPVPGLMLAAGFGLWRAVIGARREATSAVSSLDRERSDRLAGHLAGRAESASVEELAHELEWREEAVVRGLKAGVRRNLIDEDLDLDTGHWTYEVSRISTESTVPQHALPVDERAKCLTSDK